MSKVLSDHFWFKNVDFRRFWRDNPKFGYMVSLQLSATTWMINTETLIRTSTILNISFRNITHVKVLSGPILIKNVDFRRFWRGYPKFGYMVSLQFSAAAWLINTKTLLATSTIFNISFRNITNGKKYIQLTFPVKNVDFRCFFSGIL